MKYYVIAGERSGDLHASNLVKEIHQLAPGSIFRGFGGSYMKAAGVAIAADYQDMAVMGLIEVITNIFKIKRFLTYCVNDIREYQPDAVIFVDFAGFNLRIAKRIAKLPMTKIYYIAPKVWAWNQKRAYRIRDLIDKVFVVLPFEEQFYSRFEVNATYIGNPVLDSVNSFEPDPGFSKKHNMLNKDGLIAMLPGSRKQELEQLLPVMIEVARAFPDKTFGLSMIANLPIKLYKNALDEPNILPVMEDNYNLLLNSEAAVVTSGTATLETALFDVPQVVVYRTSKLNYTIGKQFVKVKYISLVNLIVDAEIVKELIQSQATTEHVTKELSLILTNRVHRNKINRGYKELRNKLKNYHASKTAAKEIQNLLSSLTVSY